MATATSIVLQDALGTPGNHTFQPLNINGLDAILVDRSNGTTARGYASLSLGLNPSNAKRATDKTKFALSVPYPVITDGVETVNDVARVTIEVVLPTSMTEQQRKNLRAYVVSMMANAVVQNYIDKLEPMW